MNLWPPGVRCSLDLDDRRLDLVWQWEYWRQICRSVSGTARKTVLVTLDAGCERLVEAARDVVRADDADRAVAATAPARLRAAQEGQGRNVVPPDLQAEMQASLSRRRAAIDELRMALAALNDESPTRT